VVARMHCQIDRRGRDVTCSHCIGNSSRQEWDSSVGKFLPGGREQAAQDVVSNVGLQSVL